MSHYQHILFATDLTAESDLLLKKASEFAKKFQAKLSLVHVLQQNAFIRGATEFVIPPDSGFESALTEQVNKILSLQAQSVGIAPENQWLLVGSIKQEVLALIAKQKIDCLAIGAHEHHGLAVLFGNATDQLMMALPCDILALRCAP